VDLINRLTSPLLKTSRAFSPLLLDNWLTSLARSIPLFQFLFFFPFSIRLVVLFSFCLFDWFLANTKYSFGSFVETRKLQIVPETDSIEGSIACEAALSLRLSSSTPDLRSGRGTSAHRKLAIVKTEGERLNYSNSKTQFLVFKSLSEV